MDLSARAARLGLLALIPALTACAATAAPAGLVAPSSDPPSPSDSRISANSNALFNDSGSPVLGDANGDAVIVLFFDYTCPFTRAVWPRVADLLRTDPKVKLILKPFVTQTGAAALPAARAALAADRQGRLAEFHNAMLTSALSPETIFSLAQRSGLDVERLRRDLDATLTYEQMIKNYALARALRIFETPTFIIGGRNVTEPSSSLNFPALVAAARLRRVS